MAGGEWREKKIEEEVDSLAALGMTAGGNRGDSGELPLDSGAV